MPNIKVSPKHGVNPSLCTCFWCQENSTGIALMGRLKGDAKAPEKILDTSYTPCDKCQKMFDEGVTLIEASPEPIFPGQPPIAKGCYPTGSTMVIKKDDVIRGLFKPPEFAESIVKKRKAFITADAFQKICGMVEG